MMTVEPVLLNLSPFPAFPQVIDSVLRSAFVSCPRQFFYSHLLHLRKRTGKSIHLHFGGCIAKGLEVTRKSYWGLGRSEIDSIADGVRALITEWGDYELPAEIIDTRAGVKTLEACVDALVSYFEYHQLGNDQLRPLVIDGKPLVEISFTFPIADIQHPITQQPILYAGRCDMVASYYDATFVVDEKTTLALGQSWRSNWTMRGQFSGYVHGMGLKLPENLRPTGAIVRGIGILKGNINFDQAIVNRPQWQLDQWLRQLSLDVQRMLMYYRVMRKIYTDRPHDAWDQNLDSSCSSYGGCAYMELCDTPDPRNWYDNYFVEEWNPLARDAEE